MTILAIVASAVAVPAGAQTIPFQLTPTDRPRIELAGHLGWTGVRKQGFEQWPRRYDTSIAGVSVGYFWTSHLKSEFGIARSGDGFLYSSEPPAAGAIRFRYLEHAFTHTLYSPSLTYQFLENRWVHPFVTGGIHVVHERHDVRDVEQGSTTRDASVFAVPHAGAGAKFFVSERAFIRTDVRLSLLRARTRPTAWTAGVGVEF